MPLTAKGEKILANFKREYGDKEGTSHFYASKNAGVLTGVDSDDGPDPMAEVDKRMDALFDKFAKLDDRMRARGDSTDRRELDKWIGRLHEIGAEVHVRYDREGHIDGVRVAGVKGIGPYEMAPISFAESMRAFFARRADADVMSNSQLETLRQEWGRLNAIDPMLPSYGKLVRLLDAASPDLLKQLAGAGIKFVSSLAQNRVGRARTDSGELDTEDLRRLLRAAGKTEFAKELNSSRFRGINGRGQEMYYVWYPNAAGTQESSMVLVSEGRVVG